MLTRYFTVILFSTYGFETIIKLKAMLEKMHIYFDAIYQHNPYISYNDYSQVYHDFQIKDLRRVIILGSIYANVANSTLEEQENALLNS